MKLFYVTNIFDLHTFGNETTNLLKCFEISTQMYFVFSFISCFFVSLFFSKWRKCCSLTFEDTFKVFKVFANLNSSSINIPYLYGLLDVLFRFFRFVIYIHINVLYVKNFMKNSHFLIQISKNHFRMCIMLQNMRMSSLVILK